MTSPRKTSGPSDGAIYRRALSIGLAGLGLVAVLVGMGSRSKGSERLERVAAPTVDAELIKPDVPELEPAPLTDALRKKGFHECNPHDLIGLGPYTAYKNLYMGRIAIPQKGGHTDDMGYDVVIHFHGHSAVRKTVVQVARGVAYVGIDKGLGSGKYSNAFQRPDIFPKLLSSIESALKSYTHDDGAHIRHVLLSAWSAGYGAVNEILKHGDDRVDAVVLLDGLHAAWNPAHPRHDGTIASLSSQPLEPTFRFAKKALEGEKIFIFTHSDVDPVQYPSTHATADLLLSELGLTRTPLGTTDDPFGEVARVDQNGFHLWSYKGRNEAAHCSHISHITEALHLIEGAWDTPAMDRNVPFTPAPKLGHGSSEEEEGTPAIELEPVAEEGGDAGVAPTGIETIDKLANPAAALQVPEAVELLKGPAPKAEPTAPPAPPPAPSAPPNGIQPALPRANE